MLSLEVIYQIADEHQLSVNSKSFLEWCTIKFNIEELLKDGCVKKYPSLPKLFNDLGISTTLSAAKKKKVLETIAKHCILNRPTQKTYEISEPLFLELSDCEDTYGVYRELFLLLFNNWLHIERPNEIIILTREEIAIQMGILNCYYQLFMGSNPEYAEIIKKIDKNKRLDDLIDNQLFYMVKNSHTKGHFYKVEHKIVEYIKEIIDIPGSPEKLVRQVFKKEVEDTRLLNIYKEACKTNKFPPECENITAMWKIIAPKNIDFKQLPDFVKQLIIRMLIINKQDKVYRQLMIDQAKQWKDFEDRDNPEAIALRLQHLFSEEELDGETRYQRVEDPALTKIIDGNEIKQINPLRKTTGLKLDDARQLAQEHINGTYTRKNKNTKEFSELFED